MAIGTKNTKVSGVLRPIPEAERPTVLAILGHLLFLAVNVVNVQHANVLIATDGAASAERANEFQFSFPDSSLVRWCAVGVPECFAAFIGAVGNFGGRAALLACALGFPATAEIAGLGAKLDVPPVGWNVEVAATMNARFIDTVFLHAAIIPAKASPMYFAIDPNYFAIAKRRIEEAAAMPLFDGAKAGT